MIKPLGDRIAVELLPNTGQVGGIFVTDSTKSTRNQSFCWANVVGHGQEVKLAKEHTKVCVSEYFGDEIDLDGKKLRVGRERDIVGVWCEGDINLRPPGDRVHVRKLDAPKMAGQIHLPEDLKAQQFKAVVLAVGDEVECGLESGQIVLVPKAVSVEVRMPDGSRFHLVDEPALLAIL